MRKTKITCLLLSFLMLFGVFSFGCGDSNSNSGKTNSNELVYDETNILTYDLCMSEVRTYLNAETDAEKFAALKGIMKGGNYDKQVLGLKIAEELADYDVYFSETKSFSICIKVHVNSNYVDTANYLVPGTKYYYKVYFEGELESHGVFKTKDAPCRWINIKGVENMRDLGGYVTESGKKVKYNMIYRSANLTTRLFSDEEAVNMFTNELGIKTEMDVRHVSDSNKDGFYPVCKWNYSEDDFVNAGIFSQLYNIPDSGYFTDKCKQGFIDAFECFSDIDRYPIVFHCTAGADRTGFMAFILNGLLGVSYEDLVRDFELTTADGNPRTARKMGTDGFIDEITKADKSAGASYCLPLVYQMLMENYGGEQNGLSYAIEQYLISLGVSKNNIDAYKSIMLD